MKKLFLLFLLVSPCFASFHYVGRTVKPTAELAYKGVKFSAPKTSYPVRHPKQTAKGFIAGVKAVF